MTVDMANLDATTLNIVNGQSGNLFGPYFNDQWNAWYTGTTFALPFTAEAVGARRHIGWCWSRTVERSPRMWRGLSHSGG